MIGRRSFLGAILGAAAAPAIVRAESLMKIVAPRPGLYVGEIGRISGIAILQEAESRRIAEMLRTLEPRLLLDRFAEPKPMPNPNLQTLTFKRYAGGPLLVPRDISIDLINNRKTA